MIAGVISGSVAIQTRSQVVVPDVRIRRLSPQKMLDHYNQIGSMMLVVSR